MKIDKWVSCGVLALFISLLFYMAPPAARSVDNENHCFTCHTNPRKLIKITRVIAKADQAKPGASIATEGEG